MPSAEVLKYLLVAASGQILVAADTSARRLPGTSPQRGLTDH
jgi:hypothetical protein